MQIKFVTKSGTEPLDRHGLRILPPRRAEREHLVPQPRPAAGSGDRQGAQGQAATTTSRASRRADRSPKNKAFFFFNYEEQRSPARRARSSAIILTPEAAAGIFSYNVGGAVRSSEPAAARGGERPARDAGSDRRQGARQTSRPRAKTSGGVTPLTNPLVQQYTWSMPTQSFNPSPTFRARLRGHAEPSPDRVDELPPHQLDARHDQQRAAAVPGFAHDRQPAVDAVDDVGIAAGRRSATTS